MKIQITPKERAGKEYLPKVMELVVKLVQHWDSIENTLIHCGAFRKHRDDWISIHGVDFQFDHGTVTAYRVYTDGAGYNQTDILYSVEIVR